MHPGFSHLQQCPEELLEMYLYCASELLSKMHHTADRFQISVKGLNHYTVVYGLKCRNVKDSDAGHQSMHWMLLEDCFKHICAFCVGYKRVRCYGRAGFNAKKSSTINKIKSTKDPGPCFRCKRHHAQKKYINT